MEWRDSLRANISLWPALASNISVLATCAGQQWDEAAFLAQIKSQGGVDATRDESTEDETSSEVIGGKIATTARTVRQTIEVMVLEGLAYRDKGNCFRLTQLGEVLFSFIQKTTDSVPFANEENIHLAGRLILPGLLAVAEYRAILLLCAETDGHLSSEELNRAFSVMSTWSSPDPHMISGLASVIKNCREGKRVEEIGPRWYKNEDFKTPNEGDQRKAINPWFLLAGGGGLVLGTFGQSERRIHPLLLADLHRLKSLTAATLQLPNRNIMESSEEFALSFSSFCL